MCNTKSNKGKAIVFLLLYVDDMLLASRYIIKIVKLKVLLASE